jgi:intracellular proteinase inhibitor BsuPI
MAGCPVRLARLALCARFALALSAVTACAGAQQAVHDAPARAAVTWATAAPTRYVVPRDSIVVWLFAPTEVRAGESVPMRVELENASGDMIELQLAGRSPRADFVVTTPSGDEVWSVFRSYVPLGGIGRTALDVGERLVFPFEWRQETYSSARPGSRVAPGQYFLHARIRFARGDVETPKRPLRITR